MSSTISYLNNESTSQPKKMKKFIVKKKPIKMKISKEQKIRNDITKIRREADKNHRDKAQKVIDIIIKDDTIDISDAMNDIYGEKFTKKVNNLLDKIVIPDNMFNELKLLF
jgi:hypothetical protein